MTKIQEKRRDAYHRQLKRCGFRSWKHANQRRGELIDKEIDDSLTEDESNELAGLQRLCDLYVKWKTNDQNGRLARRAKRLLARITQNPGTM